MQPTYIPISQAFSRDERFVVPLFQRPYVWSRQDQWEPLWEDVVGVLERLKRRVGDANVASHFLGTVVLEQKPSATGSLPCREIIDGQQRLTTLQILLKATEHSLADCLGNSDEADREQISLALRQIARLTANEAISDEVFKVWPTNEDREAYSLVMSSTIELHVDESTSKMSEAYWFFRRSVSEFINSGSVDEQSKLISDTLRNYLKIIVLDLDASDEPQAIFETLNAHGTPLLPADLIKNWLLWEAGKQRVDAEPLYQRFWQTFDRDHEYWRAKVGTGHAARARVDTFLQNWLSKETSEAVPTKHLYDRFLRFVAPAANESATDIRALMACIHDDAQRFERIDKPNGTSRFDVFLERLQRIGTVVFHPLLLELINVCEESPKELDAIGEVLESYLVRRMVCGKQTRGYGSIALKLLKAVREQSDKAPYEVILDELNAMEGADVWPSDSDFRSAWLNRKFYGQLRRDRVLMILQALENWYQSDSNKTEPLMAFDWSQLQIEHIMPQAWEEHWPLPEDISAEVRKENVQKIGNLTLVSSKLNPSLSNAPWTTAEKEGGKRGGLHLHTILYLNRMLVDQFPEGWTDVSISERSSFLFDIASLIWSRQYL